MGDAEKAPEGETTDAPGKAGGGKSKLVLIIAIVVAVLVVGGGGFFAARMMGGGTHGEVVSDDTADVLGDHAEAGAHDPAAEKAKADKHAKKEKSGGGHGGGHGGGGDEEEEVSLDIELAPITANLFDAKRGGVKVTFWLRAADAESLADIEDGKFAIRDALITMLTERTREDFRSQEGLELVKAQVLKQVERVVGTGKVTAVGLSEKVFF